MIRNPKIHKQVHLDVLTLAQTEGFGIRGLIKSPLLGSKVNAEFLVWMDQLSAWNGGDPIRQMVERVIESQTS